MLSDYAGTIDAVLARRADVGVPPDLAANRRFERQTLQDQDVAAILHPEDPLARDPRLDCRRLHAPLIFRSRGSSTQRIVDAAFFREGLVPSASC